MLWDQFGGNIAIFNNVGSVKQNLRPRLHALVEERISLLLLICASNLGSR